MVEPSNQLRPEPRPPDRIHWVRRGLTIGFLLIIPMVGVLVFALTRNVTAAWTGTGFNPFQPLTRSTSAAAPETQVGETPVPVQPVITPIPWNGKNRITILLMGLDFRDWQADVGAPRTDSMMLISLDPITEQVSLLSIPRDLWVEIPGFGHNRINTAYMFGEGNRLPGGGPALAMKTVEALIGVPIQYFAVIDFSAFERMIDEIGGVDVLVAERIKISPIGQMSHWLEPKAYHLNGAETLAYARSRKGSGGDFGRAERQQQVALAILDRVTGFDMIPTLIGKAPTLYQQLSDGIRTNMSLNEMISLVWLGASTSRDSIHTGVITPPSMVGFYTRPDGAQVLRPVPDQIRILRDQLFSDTSVISP